MSSTIASTSTLRLSLLKAPSASTSARLRTLQHTRTISSSPYGRAHVRKHHAPKLPNPVVPQFPQRVIRADGSSFTHWTTSPRSLLRLTRDVTNNPLWNISALSGEGAAEESAVTGRLGRFNRRFVEEVDWMTEAESGEGTPEPKNGGKGKKA